MGEQGFTIAQLAASHGKCVIRVHGRLTIHNAKNAFGALSAYINQYSQIAFDLSGVEAVDTAGFQILAVLKKEAERQNKVLKFFKHSTAVIDIIELYGAVGLFRDKIVVNGINRFRYGRLAQSFF